jgi:flagellar hook-associated protein 1
MSLLTSLGFARASLVNSGELSSLVSRNIANAGVDGASRKTSSTVSRVDGSVSLGTVQRVTDNALYQHVLQATSQQAAQSLIEKNLEALDQTIGDPEAKSSPAALIGILLNLLQQFSVTPSNRGSAEAAVASARQLSAALNSGTQIVQSMRLAADTSIARNVDNLNRMLAQFEGLNNSIIGGTFSSRDITDQLDKRDQLVKDMSKIIGITAIAGPNNDVALYTDSGVPLFETTPRQVSFAPTSAFDPKTTGNALFVDNVQVTGTGAPMEVQSGEIAGAANVRDSAAVSYQSQLDEIARGLIAAFSESRTSPFSTAPGLFTYSGAPAIPRVGQTGLASTIRVAAIVDPVKGGDAFMLRDGGIAGPAFKANTNGLSGFTGRIQELIGSLAGQQTFAPTAGLGASATLADFSAASAAWLGAARKEASDSADYKTTVLQNSAHVLSSQTGVNLDDQMMRLLDVERSFQASSKLITMIDSMYNALFSAIT